MPLVSGIMEEVDRSHLKSEVYFLKEFRKARTEVGVVDDIRMHERVFKERDRLYAELKGLCFGELRDSFYDYLVERGAHEEGKVSAGISGPDRMLYFSDYFNGKTCSVKDQNLIDVYEGYCEAVKEGEDRLERIIIRDQALLGFLEQTDNTKYHSLVGRYTRLRNKFLSSQMGLVLAVASRTITNEMNQDDFMDMVQEGYIGLAEAWMIYDPSLGTKFSDVACPAIRSAISGAMRNMGLMKRPRKLVKYIKRVAKAVDEIREETGRSPRINEIAERAGLTEATVNALHTNVCSFGDPVGNEDLTIGDSVPSKIDVTTEVIKGELREAIARESNRLTAGELEVIYNYGVLGIDQVQLAEEEGVTRAAISARYTRGVKKLRESGLAAFL